MAKYRKRPIVIEAIQWTGDNFAEMGRLSVDILGPYGRTDSTLKIRTLEGIMMAIRGDWIIKGVNGEVYPCKADIFEKTYEPLAAGGPNEQS